MKTEKAVASFSGPNVESILTAFSNLQCYGDDYRDEYAGRLFLNDEAYVMTYKTLEKETGLPKETLRPQVIELRDARLIELVTAFDQDYEFRRGSGYFLTEKGRAYCEANKLHDELAPKKETQHD